METHVLLLQIAAILVTARVFAEIGLLLGIPRVIGELTAGIVLGPSLLDLIQPNAPLRLLAEIGIILLLFNVGLESDMGKLIKAGGRALMLALAGFVFPFLMGFGVCFYTFDLGLAVSLFVGGTMTATSIGVTIRILDDLKRSGKREGQIVLGAAVIDDIMGVVLLAVLYEFSVSGEIGLANAARILLLIVGFFLVAPLLAKLLVLVIRPMHESKVAPGIVPIAVVALVLTLAALAHLIGAPELLGGFAAGVALSRRFFLPLGLTLNLDKKFSKVIRKQMQPIVQVFTPIFFVMVGLTLDLSSIDWASPFIWTFSIVLGIAAITGKVMSGMLLPEHRFLRPAIGMAMVPRAEVGLVFAELGRVSGIFNAEVYAAVIMVIAYTTLFSPLWIRFYYRRYADQIPDEPFDEPIKHKHSQ